MHTLALNQDSMKKRPTIKDIAKKVGVTHSTVSRVINDNPAISGRTKDKILKAMKELDYQPNLVARGLVRRKTHAFALITPDLNPHVLPVIKGISDTCRRLGYGLMLFSTDYWIEENRSYAEVVRNWLVDGVLIYNVIYHEDVPENIRELEKQNIPCVFINKFLGKNKVNNVSIDNNEAVFKAVSHLAATGHKRIGMIKGGMLSVDGVERFNAFKESLGKLELEFDESITGCGNFFFNEAYEEMKRILCAPSGRPTAMFCANDLMAMGAVKAAGDMGLKVPQDIAVAGFDDLEAARFFKPSITTLKPPLEDIGGKAIEMLLRVIENPSRPVEEIRLGSRLIVRESSVV